MKLFKLCKNCNKEFQLKIEKDHTSFQDCPHCNERNDTWLRIDYEKEKQQ